MISATLKLTVGFILYWLCIIYVKKHLLLLQYLIRMKYLFVQV